MKKLLTFIGLMLLTVCMYASEEDITSRFANGYTWNGDEKITANDDGSISYETVSWGGLATWYGGIDLSDYEKIVFEFAEATEVNTQIIVTDDVKAWGDVGITSLECSFKDGDVTDVQQIALQASAATTLVIKKVYLVTAENEEPEDPTQDKTSDLLPRFTGTWNNAESITTLDDGSKEYNSAAWGGMSAWMGGVDWSAWDALVLEFASATECVTQLMVDDYSVKADAGVYSIKLEFGDNDVSNVKQAALQTSETVTLTITAAYLIRYGEASASSATALWDFHSPDGNYYEAGSANIQGSTGTLDATADDGSTITLTVDASNNGKLYSRGNGDAQFNNGTIIKVPVVSSSDEVTVVSYPGYHNYTVGGTAADADETVYTATASDVQQGFVEIIATGSAYLYSISVVQNQGEDDTPEDPEELSYPITATWDFGDETVMANTVALSQGEGEVDDVAQDGIKMTVISNGAAFRNNGNNIQVREGAEFRIPVNTTDDVITVNGYPGYSYYTIGGGEELKGDNTYSPTAKEVKQGYVSIISTNNNNYYYKISVELNEPKESETLTDLATTATFPFHEGTEGQTADFGDQAQYFLNSKVAPGENMSITGKRTFSDIDWTKIQPLAATTAEAGSGDYVDFLIQPKFGYTFTPQSVSLKVAKYGTDNGTVDIVWVNPDGTELALATGVAPQRNNGDPGYSTLSYEVEGATVGEGACGVRVYIYGKLAANKDMDLCDITIDGLLNGEEQEVPMLDIFTANGTVYNADDVFEADGDTYKGTIELSKSIDMISADNPITAEALVGEVGEITYDGSESACTVTIPVAIGETNVITYILSVVQKPDFTLTYVNTDDTEMGTQTVEKDATIGAFAVDYTTATAEEGTKVRGWFHQKSGGQKYFTDDVVTEDITLYAVATEIEESSTYKKYNFDLTSPYFYQEDHEAFTSEGSGYWHDTTHGWAFKDGDRIALLVGPEATISVGLCRYSNANAKLTFTDASGNELGSIEGVSESDGEIAAYLYKGEAGTIYMNISAGGAVYIHNVKIVNTTEVNFESTGDWYVVKADDASSLADVLDYVAGLNSSADASRKYIFLPNGTYDFGYTALTTIAGNNISIIGQSTDGVVIKNIKEIADEGIGTTATLLNSSKNFYMQDVTLKNELDYYNSGSAGRAVCFQDKGDRTIFKNVTMLSYQDTYYSQGVSQSYWETSDIHGTVDFICGGGDVRFQDCTLSLEPRNANGSGERTITAPTTSTSFGYVFENCKVVDLSNGAGAWNFGRTWQNEPICVYLNTQLDDNAAKTLISSRWVEKGMNSKDPKLFGEYGTTDANGTDITPASNTINSHGGSFETILTADQAAGFAYDKMFTDWDPASLTLQKSAPTVSYADGVVSWTEVEGAIAYAVFVNDEFVAIVNEGTSYDLTSTDNGVKSRIAGTAPKAGDIITVRAANSMGGFGDAGEAEVALPDYEFVASEWVAGDPGRISGDNVVVDESANTITVDKTGNNNVALLFDGNQYNVSGENRYFVIKATGLSTADGASYLWWLNNKNNGSQIAPTTTYEEDGVTVLAWDLKQVAIAGTLGSEDTVFEKASDWSTTFGLTLADESTPAVISYIGFAETIAEQVEERAYEFIASEWVAGDPGRISASNVTVDEDANTITVDATGTNNVNLNYKSEDTVYTEDAKYFVIKGTGLSTADGASYLWWLNATNNGGQIPPTEVFEDAATGEVTLVWEIASTGIGGTFANSPTYLDGTGAGTWGWTTCFGLTLADDAVPAVISYIGYDAEKPIADSIHGINADNGMSISDALRNGKVFDISGRKVGSIEKGRFYIVDGKKLFVK